MKPPTHSRRFGRVFALCAALLLLAPGALATWSIVVVNTKTGEVAVATSTCLPGDIQVIVPLAVPGVGAAATQATIDNGAKNRRKIWRGFHELMAPADILNSISQTDAAFQARQIGIVSLYAQPVTFTGTGAGLAKFGVAGESGDLRYAIQGNVLTCDEVILDAEAALIATPGDISQKLMAAMQAARARGGDGRCSCNPTDPTSCGCPPPSFQKSAHNGAFIVARIGDLEGVCNATAGCANGFYYLNLNVFGVPTDPTDPVEQLQTQYDAWRLSMAGVPDQIYSKVLIGAKSLVADGHSKTSVDLQLADIDGVAIAHGGYQISVVPLPGGAGAATIGAIDDHGDGTYRFDVLAGTTTGTDRWRIVLTDATHDIVLQPDVQVRVDALTDMHCGYDQVSSSGGAPVPFTLNLGAASAGASYLVLGSASGTQPGLPFGGTTLPLNFDAFMRRSIQAANGTTFVDTMGTLDVDGRAEASFIALPGLLDAYIGQRLDFAAAILSPVQSATSAVGFDVLP